MKVFPVILWLSGMMLMTGDSLEQTFVGLGMMAAASRSLGFFKAEKGKKR
jgi:hypothetical protein